MGGLRLSKQCRKKTQTINISRCLGSRNLAKRREHIPECRDMLGGSTPLYGSFPTGDHRYANTTFHREAFRPTVFAFEWRRTVKKGRITTTIIGRTIVAGEKYQRVFIKSELFQFSHNLPYLLIQVGNHRRIGRSRCPIRKIAFVTDVGLFGTKFFLVVLDPLLRRLQGDVGNRRSEIQKERSLLVLIYETQGLL